MKHTKERKNLKLKQMIRRYLCRVTGLLVIVLLVMMLVFWVGMEKNRALETSARTLSQIGVLLEENQKELDDIKAEYRETCLHNAETVARIVEADPGVLDNVEELKKIAESVEVDEIHIFDSTGRIFTGTHPEYFGLTFDSGEQIRFFRPMLQDKTKKMVQEITPNTAEEKPMQYSAVWTENGDYIMQVGMEPVNVMKVTRKNELSYLFSLFRISPEANYYAVDARSGEIVGSTDLDTVGKNVSEIGCTLEKIEKDSDGFHARIHGKLNFCVFQKNGSNYLGRVVLAKNLYQQIPATVLGVLVSLLIVAYFLVRAVTRYLDRYVADEIDVVNRKLKSISDGNLEERIMIDSSAEFAELSRYVNFMVESLVDNNRKMSYALSKTNMIIGTYEYGSHTRKVRYTENIPAILSVTPEEMEQLSTQREKFQGLLDKIRTAPMPGETGIYRYGERYLRLEEIRKEEEVFGVALDVTSDMKKRLELEKERDVDILTGLYNRRGLQARLKELFTETEQLGRCAVVMIDADGLKTINDTYGHKSGDLYLKRTAEILASSGTEERIAARLGGDEFVLLFYGYEREEELIADIEALEQLQKKQFAVLEDQRRVPVRFSAGYAFLTKPEDYPEAVKEADQKMYQRKAERKKNRA